MGLQFDSIMNATRLTVLKIPDVGELQFEYRLAVLTDETSRKLVERAQAITSGSEQAEILAEWLARIIAWWDVYADDKPMPITKENLLTFPMYFMNMVVSHIANETSGGSTNTEAKSNVGS